MLPPRRAEPALERLRERRAEAQAGQEDGEHEPERVRAVADEQGEQVSVDDLGGEHQEARQEGQQSEQPELAARQ